MIDETSVNTSDLKDDLHTGATLVPHDGSAGDPGDGLSDAEAIDSIGVEMVSPVGIVPARDEPGESRRAC